MALPMALMSVVTVVKRGRMDVTRYHGSNRHGDEQQGNHGMRFMGKNGEHRIPLYGEAQHVRCPNGVTKKAAEKSKRVYSGSIGAVKIGLTYPCSPG
jgi:hypothetical protein